jgi:hypothetical protein
MSVAASSRHGLAAEKRWILARALATVLEQSTVTAASQTLAALCELHPGLEYAGFAPASAPSVSSSVDHFRYFKFIIVVMVGLFSHFTVCRPRSWLDEGDRQNHHDTKADENSISGSTTHCADLSITMKRPEEDVVELLKLLSSERCCSSSCGFTDWSTDDDSQ